jgi:PIN domain nuclease of toxin-antitoxin system
MALSILSITLDHAERQIGLAFHHRDPFDRLLAAQALAENIPLVSNDAIFDAYGVNRIWN